jgi:hypothetical protein
MPRQELEGSLVLSVQQRPDIGGGDAQVGRHGDFMHAQAEAIEIGIADLTAQEDFRQLVADKLAGAKLAL